MKICLLTGIAPENKLLERLKEEIKDASRIFMAVSFIRESGLETLIEMLTPIIEKYIEIKIYTSGYLSITEPEALEELLTLSNSFKNIKVFFNPADRFHSKFIFIEKEKNNYSLFLGSSNISGEGLEGIGELNVLIKGKKGDEILEDIEIVIDNLEKDPNFKEIDEGLIEEYKERFKKIRKSPEIPGKRIIIKNDITLTKERMPIYVARRQFTNKIERKIKEKHPEWQHYVGFEPIDKFKKGEYFLLISNIPRQKKEIQICKFLEYDRISDLGYIAHIKEGKSLPIKKFEKFLRLTFDELKKKSFLKICKILALKKQFANYWPK